MNICVYLFRDRDVLQGELETVKKSLLEQEAREVLLKEQMEKSTKQVKPSWGHVGPVAV